MMRGFLCEAAFVMKKRLEDGILCHPPLKALLATLTTMKMAEKVGRSQN